MKTQHQDTVAMRRRRVSTLRLKGLTHEEIWSALSNPGSPTYLVNPSTKKPYNRATITRDIQVMREEALEAAQEATQQHLARQLAELQEVKRTAWAKEKLHEVLRAIELEMKLLGTQQRADTEININLTLVQQTIEALEAAGHDPATVFNRMIANLAEKSE